MTEGICAYGVNKKTHSSSWRLSKSTFLYPRNQPPLLPCEVICKWLCWTNLLCFTWFKVGSSVLWYLTHKSLQPQKYPLKRIHRPNICRSIHQFKRLQFLHRRWNEVQNTMLKGVSEKHINSVIKYSNSSAAGGDELKDPTLMQCLYCYWV